MKILPILLTFALLTSVMAWSEENHSSHAGHSGMSQAGPITENTSMHRSAGPTKEEGHSHKRTIRNGEAMEAMPMISPKRIYTVTGKEDFDAIMGYGRDEGMVAMMNLMMVEGSGMEGMEMEPMEMGTSSGEDPLAPETLPKYLKGAKVASAHAGHQTQAKTPSVVLKAEIQPNPPVVGENRIAFSLARTGTGQKIKGESLKAKVEMANMNMGVTEPSIKETQDGHYELTAKFSMKGPWRVTIQGSSADDPKESIQAELLFDVGSKDAWVQKE